MTPISSILTIYEKNLVYITNNKKRNNLNKNVNKKSSNVKCQTRNFTVNSKMTFFFTSKNRTFNLSQYFNVKQQ